MKTSKIILFLFISLFIFMGISSKAQELRDTIVTKKNEKIVCKITKITDTDIEYKKDKEADAIIYEISKTKVKELRLGNGTIVAIVADEMDMNKEIEIIDKRSAVKIHFFAPFFNHLAVTYERSLKMGTNIEATIGLINNSMFRFNGNSYGNLIQGATVVFGPKFILGHSFYIKGMKYSHPLKGGYFKPEIILTAFAEKNLKFNIANSTYPYQYTTYNTDLRVKAVSLLINYGSQYILGNALTFGYNFGLGYAFAGSRYTSKEVRDYISLHNSYYGGSSDRWSGDLFNQFRLGWDFPLTIACNITLGYIFK